MEHLVFLLYLVLIIYLLNVIPFFKKSGLNPFIISGLLLIKVGAGYAYSAFYKLPKYYQGSDTWRFYRSSLDETKWLIRDPIAFIKDLFVFGYNNSGNLFAGKSSYWNDLKSNVPVKIMAVMNVITNNSYYTNIILFNFLFFIGLISLFKVFDTIFPKKKFQIIIGLFLLPSTLFWCSGIHKDGLILSCLGIITYCIFFGLKVKFTPQKISAILICAVLIFSLRNYVVIALIPAIACLIISNKAEVKKTSIYVIAYSISLIVFFSAKYLSPKLDFPNYIAIKQREFQQLEGSSSVHLNPLEPTLKGFVAFLPEALDMAFLRPHITEAKNFSYLPAALENLLLILIVILALIKGKGRFSNPVVLFCLFFSVSLLLLAGYTITLSGAIVRYRSISLPFLITPLLCMLTVKRHRNTT